MSLPNVKSAAVSRAAVLRRPLGWLFSVCLLLLGATAHAAGDAAAGKSLYPVCTACHGPTGLGNQAMNAPKLAGQEPWYLVRQMQMFQNGSRGTAAGDMHGAQMAAMAKGPQLASEEALQNLAAYIATFPVADVPETVTGDAAAGQKLYVVCAACHGPQAEGVEALGGPRLAGQSDWYLVTSINKYKNGQRGYHATDHRGRQMAPMVATLTSDQAVADIVAYINSLP